jgi:heat shock protein HslJ
VTKRTSRVLGLTVALICLLALGAGCGNGTAGEEPPLDGTRWTLSDWAEPDQIPTSAPITAEFSEGRVAGTSGVNRYSASVTSGPDGSFAVDAPISTKMAGPADAMAAESSYLRRLQAATSYQIDGDTLVIDDADGQPSLTFTRT